MWEQAVRENFWKSSRFRREHKVNKEDIDLIKTKFLYKKPQILGLDFALGRLQLERHAILDNSFPKKMFTG